MIKGQLKQIREGGLKILARKFFACMMVLISTPIILFVRLLRPLKLIRFGGLSSNRIGNYIIITMAYLREREVGRTITNSWDIFYQDSEVCNQQLLKMFKRMLTVWEIAYWLDKTNHLIPGGDIHSIKQPRTRDGFDIFEEAPVYFQFTPEENIFGWKECQKVGLSQNDTFVCFHERNSNYLKKEFPHMKYGYDSHRDANIDLLRPALSELTRKGYYAVRMGKYESDAFVSYDEKIIDYAYQAHSDFLDIFLGSQCRFFISSACGASAIALAFKKPICWVNAIPLEYVHAWASNYLYIFKKIWYKDERRFLTFKEIIDSGAGRFGFDEQYVKLGLEPIENTPEEIKAVVSEMDQRLSNNCESNEEDEELQRRFWAHFKPNYYNKVFNARIGAEFLRQNKDLLVSQSSRIEKSVN